jgi:hypothetical protein
MQGRRNPEVAGSGFQRARQLRRGHRRTTTLKNMHEISTLAASARGKAFVRIGRARRWMKKQRFESVVSGFSGAKNLLERSHIKNVDELSFLCSLGCSEGTGPVWLRPRI